jgi:hypothetical protein
MTAAAHWLALAAVAALAVVAQLAAREPEPSPAEREEPSGGSVARARGVVADAVRAGEVAADLKRWLGQTVAVGGEVATVYGSRVFTLDEDRIGAKPDVLVLAPDHANVESGSSVTVRGTVRRYAWTELRREYDWFELPPSLGVVFHSRPVVIAESVRSGGEVELVGRPRHAPLGQLARQGGDYYGDFVTVRGPVGEGASPHVFTLTGRSGRPDVLVLNPSPEPEVKLDPRAPVTVEGVVRPFYFADLKRDYEWFSADPHLVARVEDRPVVVAESIRMESGRELVREQHAAKSPAPRTARR